jgi:hypothetical protein
LMCSPVATRHIGIARRAGWLQSTTGPSSVAPFIQA